MVIAQTILVLPVIAALSRQLVGDSLRDGGDQLRSMGAGPLLCALLMLRARPLGGRHGAADRLRPRHRRGRAR